MKRKGIIKRDVRFENKDTVKTFLTRAKEVIRELRAYGSDVPAVVAMGPFKAGSFQVVIPKTEPRAVAPGGVGHKYLQLKCLDSPNGLETVAPTFGSRLEIFFVVEVVPMEDWEALNV